MTRARVFTLTLLALVAFAGNSLLCRVALKHTAIDPASFTSVRLVSGALVLWLLARSRAAQAGPAGNWRSALALFAYAVLFSWAYVSLTAATGALLLFGAVQATMIGYGWWMGERLRARQLFGFVLAVTGLIGLLLPGLSAPPLQGSLLMLAAGAAWGIYTLRGKGSGDPTRVTAGNFLRAVVPTAVLSVATLPWASLDARGVAFAIASGALASALGYIVWYAVLPRLKVSTAATAQLSVPMIAALGGIVFLGEAPTLRLVVASAAILGGIACVVMPSESAAARRA
ncbi:DMT family transporter [Piscinibacter sp. XHJ-5]|uniref:DMT family transporter n=1 Tax=Piscinibacter sp. XHJ-5 TaxID=3037797 RepID=UPI002452F4F2|nr:DMT family transporter [Piscinibacter sp. XHJ-5]